MRSLLTVIVVALAAAALAAAPAPEAKPALPPGAVFMIGTPDGLGGEFGCADESWPNYLKVFPKPVVYTVGKSKVTDWPYIHPSNDDKWAGGRPHTFTLRFASEQGDPRPLYLLLGLNDAMPRPPMVTVAVNGAALPTQRAPAGTARGAFTPDERHAPGTMVFSLPAGAVRAGDNEITIHCETASWMVYDYVLLTADATPPKLSDKPPPVRVRKKSAEAEPERDDTLLEKALAGPLAGVEDVVFAARQPGKDGHWYANFSYYAENDQRLTYGDGGKLCRLNLRTGKVTNLLDDPKGGVRDPQVHYDGKRIVFSYRKGGGTHYNLYEIGIDGAGLRQLTDGPYDDIEPTYLSDGGIMFVSSRCNRWVNCWLTQVAVLHRCDADGKNIRMVSSNNEQDNTPWPLADGTVLYTRWEYVDRSQVDYHHLWIVNPDGADQMVYYGNLRPGTVMIDSKPIPGTDKIVSIFSPGHGQKEHAGPVAIVDPSAGPDDPSSARIIARGQDYRDPYPLSEDCYLVARGADLLLMSGSGAVQTVYTLPPEDRKAGLWLHEPRPVMPRPHEPDVADKSNPAEATGRLMLIDVTKGRNMAGVQPGEVKKLLILESLPKPINFTGGMEPLSYGGTFTLERVLGTVPV
ncbi:MAG: polysaccharide lyase family protein, partial [Planctomycetota bacterium]|nr:polysaccharide lyase family protein [Planctomycetota bacterium]